MSLLIGLGLSPLAAAAPAPPGAVPPAAPTAKAPHDRAYWRAIITNDYAVPAGETPLALVRELSRELGSTDPEMRDTFAYDIPATWIYRDSRLSPDDLRILLDLWSKNLRAGVGETGTDSVLLRSFSALDLSVIAAYDNQRPFLEKPEFSALLAAAINYLAAEKDIRGYVPGKGWHHSVAHTADLLKFLARSRHLEPADAERLLAAIEAKLGAVDEVLVWGEDDRLAAAVLSLLKRPDLDRPAFDAWVGRRVAAWKGLWSESTGFDASRHASARNGRNLLRALYVQVGGSASFEARDALATALLDALKKM